MKGNVMSGELERLGDELAELNALLFPWQREELEERLKKDEQEYDR